ncbi:MAG: hypothetical protein IPM98_21090 [Lewinellaceae bacterium]|nr:hypothetical protein [Lewinellaceae bacterium]
MIRIIVGRLLEIGAGEMSLRFLKATCATKDAACYYRSISAGALFVQGGVSVFELPQQTVFGAVFGDEPAGYWI